MPEEGLSLNVKFHPWAVRRHRPNVPKHSHFDGEPENLAMLVATAIAAGNVLPGKYPGTFVVAVEDPSKAALFCAPGERHNGHVAKPQATFAKIIVWSAQALAKDGDKLATECTHAVVGIRAVSGAPRPPVTNKADVAA